MITPIYHELSDKLEHYIREENFSGRLPGQGTLGRRFKVNEQTISKALHLLADRGIVEIRGTRGTFVNPKAIRKPRHKVIGLIGLPTENERDAVLTQLEDYAMTQGYHLLGIREPASLFSSQPSCLAELPVDGLMFCYSTLTQAMALALKNAEIPVVSCHRCFSMPWVNSLDFDHASHFRMMLGDLREQGHRRIAILANPIVPHFEEHGKWLRDICRDCLQQDFHEELFEDLPLEIMSGLGPPKLNADSTALIEKLLATPNPPTAAVMPGYLFPEIMTVFKDRGIRIPQDLSVAAWGPQLPPNISHIFCDYRQIWFHGLKRMLTVLKNRQEEPALELLTMAYHRGNTIAPPKASAHFPSNRP